MPDLAAPDLLRGSGIPIKQLKDWDPGTRPARLETFGPAFPGTLPP